MLKTILLCADSKSKQILTDFLETFGYDIVLSTSYAFECIDAACKLGPDIIISDTFVYDLDTALLFEQLSCTDAGKNALLIAVGSTVDNSVINSLTSAGADIYCLLPTDFSALDKNIRKSLSAKRNQTLKENEYQSDEYKIKTHIKYLLTDLGVKLNNVGFKYILDAVYITITLNNSSDLKITKHIYPVVAEKYNATAMAVERAIRTEIVNVWRYGDISLVNEIFGYTVNSDNPCATNLEFVRIIADRVMMDLRINIR